MQNKLDKLFKEKLVNHSIRPTELAWEKISVAATNGSAKYARKIAVVRISRIAAAVVLLAFIGLFLMDSATIEKKVPIAKESINAKKPEGTIQVVAQSPSKATFETTKPTQAIESKKTVQLVAVKIQKEAALKEIEMKEFEIVSAPTLVEEVGKTEIFSEANGGLGRQDKPMVIIYSLASIEPKREKELKVNSFKKVIEFAKEVKGGEATLASVRDWKDNFFGAEVNEHTQLKNNH